MFNRVAPPPMFSKCVDILYNVSIYILYLKRVCVCVCKYANRTGAWSNQIFVYFVCINNLFMWNMMLKARATVCGLYSGEFQNYAVSDKI